MRAKEEREQESKSSLQHHVLYVCFLIQKQATSYDSIFAYEIT